MSTPATTPATTTAPASGNCCTVCGKAIGPAYLMCPPHWQLVPRALKSLVYRTWGDYTRSRKYPGTVQAKLLRDYEATAQEATAAAQQAIEQAISTEGTAK